MSAVGVAETNLLRAALATVCVDYDPQPRVGANEAASRRLLAAARALVAAHDNGLTPKLAVAAPVALVRAGRNART